MSNIKLFNDDYLKIIENASPLSIDLILTDIPYQISRLNNFKTMKDRTGRQGIDFGEWDNSFDISKLNNLSRLLKPDGSLLMFSSFEQFGILRKILIDLDFKDKIIWHKTNPMPRNRDRRWISDIEIISFYINKGAKWTFNRQSDKYESSILNFPSESGGGFKRYHPTQKNLKMIEYILKIHSNKDDLILDPLMGSGTVGVACQNLNRNFIGIELDKKYFDIAKQRIAR